MPMSDPNAWATAMNNLGMPPIGMTGQQLMPGTALPAGAAETFVFEVYLSVQKYSAVVFLFLELATE